MAVIIPIAMAYAGATTATIAFTTIAMAVTGVSAKVDRAASKVFGEDVVKFANIAGAIYMAGSGAFGGGEAAAAGDGLGSVVDATGGMETAVGSTANTGVPAAVDATGGLETATPPPSGVSEATSNVGVQLKPIEPQGALARAAQPKGDSVAAKLGELPGKAADAFAKLDPRVQAALVQVGGGALSGFAQGKAREAELERIEQENRRYRSGSGLPYWARGAALPTPGGGT